MRRAEKVKALEESQSFEQYKGVRADTGTERLVFRAADAAAACTLAAISGSLDHAVRRIPRLARVLASLTSCMACPKLAPR